MEGSKIGQAMTEEEFAVAKVMMPGTEEVVLLGDTLVVTDNEGMQLAFSARLDDDTRAFFVAFDNWLVAKRGGIVGPVIDGLWHLVEQGWADMPMHVVRQMPSFASFSRPTG